MMDSPELRAAFLDEAEGLLAQYDEALASIAAAPEQPKPAQRLRIVFHSLKGLAAILNLTDFRELSGHLEQLVTPFALQKEPLPADAAAMSQELRPFIRSCIAAVREAAPLPDLTALLAELKREDEPEETPLKAKPRRSSPSSRTASSRAASSRVASGRAASGKVASGRAASGRAASGRAASGRAASGRAASGRAASQDVEAQGALYSCRFTLAADCPFPASSVELARSHLSEWGEVLQVATRADGEGGALSVELQLDGEVDPGIIARAVLVSFVGDIEISRLAHAAPSPKAARSARVALGARILKELAASLNRARVALEGLASEPPLRPTRKLTVSLKRDSALLGLLGFIELSALLSELAEAFSKNRQSPMPSAELELSRRAIDHTLALKRPTSPDPAALDIARALLALHGPSAAVFLDGSWATGVLELDEELHPVELALPWKAVRDPASLAAEIAIATANRPPQFGSPGAMSTRQLVGTIWTTGAPEPAQGPSPKRFKVQAKHESSDKVKLSVVRRKDRFSVSLARLDQMATWLVELEELRRQAADENASRGLRRVAEFVIDRRLRDLRDTLSEIRARSVSDIAERLETGAESFRATRPERSFELQILGRDCHFDTRLVDWIEQPIARFFLRVLRNELSSPRDPKDAPKIEVSFERDDAELRLRIRHDFSRTTFIDVDEQPPLSDGRADFEALGGLFETRELERRREYLVRFPRELTPVECLLIKSAGTQLGVLPASVLISDALPAPGRSTQALVGEKLLPIFPILQGQPAILMKPSRVLIHEIAGELSAWPVECIEGYRCVSISLATSPLSPEREARLPDGSRIRIVDLNARADAMRGTL